jgi:hypothetical protein
MERITAANDWEVQVTRTANAPNETPNFFSNKRCCLDQQLEEGTFKQMLLIPRLC